MYWLLRPKSFVYKFILKPIWMYGVQPWECAKKFNTVNTSGCTVNVIQRSQSKVLSEHLWCTLVCHQPNNMRWRWHGLLLLIINISVVITITLWKTWEECDPEEDWKDKSKNVIVCYLDLIHDWIPHHHKSHMSFTAGWRLLHACLEIDLLRPWY